MNEVTLTEFANSGFIAMINIAILWPRGLALGYDRTDDGTVIEGTLRIYRAGEPITDGHEPGIMEAQIRSLLDWDIKQEGESIDNATS